MSLEVATSDAPQARSSVAWPPWAISISVAIVFFLAGLIQRFYGAPFELNQLRRVFGLFGATIVAAFVSGIVGTLGFIFFHPSASSAVTIWRHWVASDTLG